jgi:hypothetical protein
MITGLQIRVPELVQLPRAWYAPAGAVLGAAMLMLSLTPAAEAFVARVLLFYAGVSLAYALMPFVRRGDIPLVAAWVVLLAELAPCFAGRLISPVRVSADVLGVTMAVVPIYLARLRQVQQGDTRASGRRATDGPSFG